MARIRTIKPDFWTDEKLVECSMTARLLFIGIWNFSDDNGNLGRSSKKIKMQIFPADTVDCEPFIQELIHQDLLQEYSADGQNFLHVKGFKKHQVINKPSKTTIPLPEGSGSTPVVIPELDNTPTGVLPDGKERKGKEKEYISLTDGSCSELSTDLSTKIVNEVAKDLNLNDFFNCIDVVCLLFQKKSLHKPDQERLANWCEIYDMRDLLGKIETELINQELKNGRQRDSFPVKYFDFLTKKLMPKNKSVNIVKDLAISMRLN